MARRTTIVNEPAVEVKTEIAERIAYFKFTISFEAGSRMEFKEIEGTSFLINPDSNYLQILEEDEVVAIFKDWNHFKKELIVE